MHAGRFQSANILGALAVLLASGCAYFSPATSPQRVDRGYIVMLPGIEGPSAFNSNVAAGLLDARTDKAVEVHDWSTGFSAGFLVHLQNLPRNREQARRLAMKIVRYQDEYPGRPVYLIGHSGGAGIALLTLEALPDGRRIESAILLAGAVSRDYDLRHALSKTTRGIWNYHSPGDWLLLVAGTSLFGTIDRVYAPSAGAYGFRVPDNLDDEGRRQYAKLQQVSYDFGMIASGNYGGHFGPSTRGFARDYLTPVIESRALHQPLRAGQEKGVTLFAPVRVPKDNPALRDDQTQPVLAGEHDRLPTKKRKGGQRLLDKAAFVYDRVSDRYLCPQGKPLTPGPSAGRGKPPRQDPPPVNPTSPSGSGQNIRSSHGESRSLTVAARDPVITRLKLRPALTFSPRSPP